MPSPETPAPQGQEKQGFSLRNFFRGLSQEGRHEAMGSEESRQELQRKRDQEAKELGALEASHREQLEAVQQRAETDEHPAVLPEALREAEERGEIPPAEQQPAAPEQRDAA